MATARWPQRDGHSAMARRNGRSFVLTHKSGLDHLASLQRLCRAAGGSNEAFRGSLYHPRQAVVAHSKRIVPMSHRRNADIPRRSAFQFAPLGLRVLSRRVPSSSVIPSPAVLQRVASACAMGGPNAGAACRSFRPAPHPGHWPGRRGRSPSLPSSGLNLRPWR